MKKFFKFFGWFILSIVVLAEIAFVFVLPNVIDINNYKSDIQKIAKEQGFVNLNFENAKIITTPLFSAGIQLNNISIKLDDGSNLFVADKLKTRIALPSLLLLTVKVSAFEVENSKINLEIAPNDFKLLTLIQNIINQQKSTIENSNRTNETQLPLGINPEQIKIKIPAAKLKNYTILSTDLKTGHYLDLRGDELLLGYFNGKTIKLKTNAKLYNNNNENININIDLDTSIPTIGTKLDEEDDKAQRIDIPFFNPVKSYMDYDLKANVDTKLKVRYTNNNQIISFGHLNIDKLSLKLSGIQLPESYLHAKTFGKKVSLDTNLSIKDNQNINILGKFVYGHNPKINMNIKTDKIYYNDLLILAKALLDSFDIPNELSNYSAEGYIEANAFIKTNFKKLKSFGKIIINQGALSIKGIGKIISNANINIILDDNSLNIQDSTLSLGNASIIANGGIDKKSFVDIKVKSSDVHLPQLYKAFAPRDIKNSFDLASGILSFNLSAYGYLHNTANIANFSLSNLNFSDKAKNFIISNGNLNGNIDLSPKILHVQFFNKNFTLTLPKTNSKIISNKLKLTADNNNIVLDENNITINDNSQINYRGNIKNYNKLEKIDFSANGNIDTNDIVKIIGKEFDSFIHKSGKLPVTVALQGNEKKQTLFARILADKQNFFTPIDFSQLKDSVSALQAKIDFKKHHLKIKDTGLFTKTISYDKKGNETEILTPIVSAEGTIVNTRINLFEIKRSIDLDGKIHAFSQSSFHLSPAKVFVYGQTDAPRLHGTISIEKLLIPELFLSLDKAKIKLQSQQADFNIENLLLNDSDFQINGILSLIPASTVNLHNIQVNSKLIDADKIMKVSDAAMKYVPQSNSSAAADIPVTLGGNINFNKVKSGNITINDIISKISLKKNIFYLDNLKAKIFGGNVNGNISMNLLSTLLNVKVKGKNINMEKMLLDAAAMKDTLSGKTSFDTDISLKGSTFEEQVKTLKGTISFDVQDGQFGPFGKIENLILAENIRESQLFQTALGGIINNLTTIDTTHFQHLAGKINFQDGICNIEEITSQGKVLAMHLFGQFDILKNTADMKVRAKMTSAISNLLGPIAMINPINIVNSAAGLNIFTAKAFSLFCEVLTDEEAKTLPSFDNKYVDNSAMKFQLGIRGDVAKPLTLIKSFKWLSTPLEFQAAKEFVDSIPEPIEGSSANTIEEVIKENEALEAEKQTLQYKLKHIFDKKEQPSKPQNQSSQQQIPEETQSIIIEHIDE